MVKLLFLSVGTFALGVDAYIMAGLLPGIGTNFDVSAAIAGQTVSVFTLVYAVSAPILGALAAGEPPKRTLLLGLAIFSVANAGSSLSPSFGFLLVTRAIAGIGAGLFTPTAIGVAAALVSPSRRGRALAFVMGGLAMGTAVGIPLGLVIADSFGWRGSLWLVTALGGIAFAGVAIRLPHVSAIGVPSLGQRLALLLDRQVMATVAISFLTAVGTIGLYTYVAPVLVAGAKVESVLPYLWAWSLGGLAGTYFSGSIIDKTGRASWVMAAMLALIIVSLAFLELTITLPIVTLAAFFIWGAGGWGAQAPQQHRLLSLKPEQGSTAVALHSSAHYLGSAAGAALFGAALAIGVHVVNLPRLSLGILAIALIGQIAIAWTSRS